MHRRDMLKIGTGAVVAGLASSASAAPASSSPAATNPAGPNLPSSNIAQWGLFEFKAQGPSSGNPFIDVQFGARFTFAHRTIDVPGFYDGNGTYKVRFSPDTLGPWTLETTSNAKDLAGLTAAFNCIAPSEGNRGPVGTAHQFHFQYADATPYFPFGTTCYAYGFIPEPWAGLTLKNLKSAGFNKVRICLLPKGLGNLQPVAMPFEPSGQPLPSGAENLDDSSKSKQTFDLTRLNPAYFQQFESRILDLQAAGIEADVILFHPYDAWGFKSMTPEADDRYLRYAIARLSAYRNVWWAIANEYDLIRSKSMTDWDRFFRIVQSSDPYSRLRSIHHSRVVYDHSKPWCTHASLQQYDFEKSPALFAAWNKPIIYDEIQYEGNISSRWGNLSAEEMTHRFWRATVYGVYATHGETFMTTDNSPVWSNGGNLLGSSPARITWLRKLLEKSGTTGLMAQENPYYLNAGNPGFLILYYFDYHSVGEYTFPLPEKINFKATLIDPWAMTESPLSGTFTGKSKITLTGKPHMAILFEKT